MNRGFRKIMKNADDMTLNELSNAAPLSEEDKDRIFSESMRKLREKQNGSAPRIIMNRTKNSNTDDNDNYETSAQVKRGGAKAIISIAASLAIVAGLAGIFLNGGKLTTAPEKSSSAEQKITTTVQTAPAESTSESTSASSDEAVSPTADSESGSTESTAEHTSSAADDSSEVSAPDVKVIIPDSTSQAETVSQEPSKPDESSQDDSSEADKTDSEKPIPEGLATEIEDSITHLNEIEFIASGHLASSEYMFDENFDITEDPSALRYYRVPHGNVERYNTFDTKMYQGHMTNNFVLTMGYTSVTYERFLLNNNELYFKTEYYNDDYPVYTRADDEIHMTGDNSCYVLVKKSTATGSDLSTYKLSFVHESVITADTFIWKIDSITIA